MSLGGWGPMGKGRSAGCAAAAGAGAAAIAAIQAWDPHRIRQRQNALDVAACLASSDSAGSSLQL